MSGPFTLDPAVGKGLGTSPGSTGVALNASKPAGNGSAPPPQTFYIRLEDNAGFILLEDGSGYIELEDGP